MRERLKMDLVKVEEKHTINPGVHPGNNNPFNNNDYKLLSMAEQCQNFLKELAEHWCFKQRGAEVVFKENKGRLSALLTHERLHCEE